MSEFTSYLHEVFAQFGPISARRMFGGHGIYHDELMFGLVLDDTLYLKGDAATVGFFETRGLEPATYHKRGRVVTLSYYRAPEEIFDDPDEAALWARRAFEAAMRARNNRR